MIIINRTRAYDSEREANARRLETHFANHCEWSEAGFWNQELYQEVFSRYAASEGKVKEGLGERLDVLRWRGIMLLNYQLKQTGGTA